MIGCQWNQYVVVQNEQNTWCLDHVDTLYSGPSILRPLMGPRKCGLILQVVLK